MDMVGLKKGRRGAIAKAISIVENDPKEAKKLIKKIFAKTGNSTIIGITGPAGAGKSSLIDKLVLSMKKSKTNPAVLAVDPTSHVTGGAILGDRVRMSESTDSGTFIRSIASRGATGAVSRSLRNSIRVLEYAGFDPIIIESVGAGQTEIDISKIADITVVVFNPNTGDSIQTIKAGLTEIGDIYIINKSDLVGADRLYNAVCDFIGDSGEKPVVLKTSVKKNTGISALAKELVRLADTQNPTPDGARLKAELRDIILSDIEEKLDKMMDADEEIGACIKKMLSKKMDPFQAGEKITRLLAG